jgi:hypothetical protein
MLKFKNRLLAFLLMIAAVTHPSFCSNANSLRDMKVIAPAATCQSLSAENGNKLERLTTSDKVAIGILCTVLVVVIGVIVATAAIGHVDIPNMSDK